jgi:hypothetical protein
MLFLEGKKRGGFVLVYTFLIVSICSAAALACFRLRVLERDGRIHDVKVVQRADTVQRDREYLLLGIDGFISSRLDEISEQTIRELFTAESGFRAAAGESSAQYAAAKGSFYLCYNSGGKFVMEELVRCSVGENGVVYMTAAFSYKKGALLQ